jgi:hypothetical protein
LTVSARRSASYRILLPATAFYGQSVSNTVTVVPLIHSKRE